MIDRRFRSKGIGKSAFLSEASVGSPPDLYAHSLSQSALKVRRTIVKNSRFGTYFTSGQRVSGLQTKRRRRAFFQPIDGITSWRPLTTVLSHRLNTR